MMEFYVMGQNIRYACPVIAANSLDFLQARFYFSGDVWEGYSKWAHFRQGDGGNADALEPLVFPPVGDVHVLQTQVTSVR